MNSITFCGFAALGALCFATTARAEDAPSTSAQGLTEEQAVARAVVNNPSLHVALLRASQGRLNVRAEEALYTPVLDASGGYTRARVPSLSGDEGVRFSTNDLVDLGVGLTKPFATGTVLAARVSGQRALRTSTIDSTLPDGTTSIAFTGGPAYSLVGRLGVSQPLLRGFGSELGLSSLRQARLSSSATDLLAQETASNVLSQVVSSYWEAWYAHEVTRINEASLELSRVQMQQAEQQVASGALAPASALPYATRVAELEEAVLSARTEARQRELLLSQLLGEPGGFSARVTPSDVPRAPVADEPIEARAVEEALGNSYAQAELKVRVALAKEQLKVAGDPLRPRLDLDAYVQAEGLGNQRLPPAFEQVGRLQAVSAHVGLTFEMPLTDTRRTAQIESAKLSAHIAEKQLLESELSIRSGVASALARLRAARERTTLSARTEAVALQQAEAERARFQAGSSIAISVQEAENSLRQAQLRAQRAKVDVLLAELSLSELRGQLLSRYAGALARLPAGDRGALESRARNF